MVVASKNAAQPDGALAVPWSAVEPDLADVLAANREFHKRNRTWDEAAPRPPMAAVHAEVVIEAALSEAGMLESLVRLDGTELCRQQAPLPREVDEVWTARRFPAPIAGERLADAGRRLARALLDDAGQATLARQLKALPPGSSADVVLVATGACLSLPVELIRLAADGGDTGPLGLLPNVSVMRRMAASGFVPGSPLPLVRAPDPLPGPLKILAAVAAPDESKTRNAPLDVEAEMGAVLDAVSEVTAGDRRRCASWRWRH